MARLEIHRHIAAPVNEVAAFFVPQRMPYWYGVEIQAQFELSDGCADFQAGQKIRITGQLGRREVSLTAVVTRYEWARVLEWRFRDAAGVRGLQSWELAAASPSVRNANSSGAPAGETRVVMRDEYEMPGAISRVADRLFTRHAVARRDRDALARLARLAERR
jgi:uncharacterized protein YndB with AHSA1/START domain